MAMKESKSGNHSITTIESSSFVDETGKRTTINETWTSGESQRELSKREIKRERRESFSEFLGVGRYFVIFCLILFFIAPVYNDLIDNYTWVSEKNGNTYKFTNPNENDVESYKYLGNKMMQGFTETLDTIGSISDTANNITTSVGNVTSWFTPVYEKGKELFKGALDWFNGLFD